MKLSDEERRELLAAAESSELRRDMTRLSARSCDHFRDAQGRYDPGRFLDWVTEYNELLGHPRKPFRPIIITDARL